MEIYGNGAQPSFKGSRRVVTKNISDKITVTEKITWRSTPYQMFT